MIMFKLKLTDPWNIAHITIIKTKNITDSLILQSCAATACNVNVYIASCRSNIYMVNNDLFGKN